MSLQTAYEARVRELQSQINEGGALGPLLLAALAVGSFLMLALGAMRGEVTPWLLILPVPVIIWAVRQILRAQRGGFRQVRLRRYYDRAISRVKGEWVDGQNTGAEFAESGHVYTNDLNCFGDGSLFQLLCTVRTAIGRRRLAEYLSEPPAIEETLARQAAVAELSERRDLREAAATLGEYDFMESRSQPFEEWLAAPPFDYWKVLPWLSAFASVALVTVAVAGAARVISLQQLLDWSVPFAGFHALAGVYFRDRVKGMVENLQSLAAETDVLREGLQLLESQTFTSPKLAKISAQAKGAGAAIGKLDWPLYVLAHRDQDMAYLLSRYLLAGTQACMALERWRRTHGEALLAWLDAWAEFEALNALATYAHEHPGDIHPELAPEACFTARELGHPLLDLESCVVNDVELNARARFYIISGSNMSGKSTLLRAIGLNTVLAFAGAPVRARSLRLSGLTVVASISVGDSLLHGRSKFLAEIERLRQAIESDVPNRPVLFLVDEIFSGTNSRDRRVAAEAVVRTLVNRGAIGALSTHDLALTEIAGLGGVNVHMGARDGGAEDPMDFDYLVKPGVTTESNALAIARMAGVPV